MQENLPTTTPADGPGGPTLESPSGKEASTPEDSLNKRAAYFESLVKKGEATKGQKAWLESYNSNPMAANQLHHFNQLKAEGETLTKGQEAYLKSYAENSRAPSIIHYFAQVIADGETLTDYQKDLLKTYEESRKPEPKPNMPRW